MAPLSHPLGFLLVALAGWINQQQRDVIDYLRVENRVLREQLGPRRLRFTDDQRVRLAAKAEKVGRHLLSEIGTLVTPDTLLAWHRRLIARRYDGHPKRGPGRPGVLAEIRQLVVRMASENRAWGYTRIQGALANLNHHVARGTIANILRQHGIEPAPERQKRTTWQEFLSVHWDVLAAADFFTVEVWTGRGLTRYAVLFVIDLATRRVEIAGIASEPDCAWVKQCGRQITNPIEGCLRGKRFLLHDRDPLFSDAFRETLPRRRRNGTAPPALPQFERVRGTLRTDGQRIVPRPDDFVRRTVVTSSNSRVHGALPSRTEPSGHGQPAPLSSHHDCSGRRTGRLSSTAGWTAEVLSPTGCIGAASRVSVSRACSSPQIRHLTISPA